MDEEVDLRGGAAGGARRLESPDKPAEEAVYGRWWLSAIVAGQLEAASSRIRAMVSGRSSAEKWPVRGTVMR